MRARDRLDAPEALVLTMVLVAAADGGMTDREIGVMAGQVQTLPAFQDFTSEQLGTVSDAAVRLLLEAVIRVREGAPAEAVGLLDQAEEQRPKLAGAWNGQPFAGAGPSFDITRSPLRNSDRVHSKKCR